MASKKDMRRADLIIPYQPPKPKESTDISSTMGSTLPMAAMFTRNKYIGWTAVVYALQTWLSESEESKKTASQPAIFSVLIAFLSLGVTYLPLFLPPQPGRGPVGGSGTAPPAPSA